MAKQNNTAVNSVKSGIESPRNSLVCQESIKELAEINQKLQVLVDSSPVAIITFDLEGRITLWNRAAEEISGWRAEDLLGREFPIVTEGGRAEYNHILEQIKTGQSVTNIEMYVVRKDGTPIYISLSASPLRNAEGYIYGLICICVDISQRREAERALYETSMQLLALFDASPLAIHSIDLQSRVMLWNKASERLFGWTAEEVIDRPLPTIPNDKREEHIDLREKLYRGGTVSGFETLRVKKDGSPVDVSLSAARLQDEEENIIGAMAVYEDISDRKRAEKALQASEERYRSVFNYGPSGFVVWDTNFRIVEWNEQAEVLFEWTRAEAVGRNFFDLIIPPSALPQVELIVERLLSGEVQRHVINENITKSGRIILCEWNNALLRDSDGNVTAAISLALDITDRKRAEEAVQASEMRFRTLVETAPLLMWITDGDGNLEFVNQNWYDYTGTNFEQMITLGWDWFVHPADRAMAYDLWKQSLATGENYHFEYRIRGHRHGYRWFLSQGSPLRDGTGQIVKWFGACTDIHVQKQEEEKERFLAYLALRTRNLPDPEQVLHETVHELSTYLQASHCGCYTIDDAHDRLVLRSEFRRNEWGISGMFALPEVSSVILPDLNEGRAAVNQDTRTDRRTSRQFNKIFAPIALRAYLIVPISRDERWIGAFAVATSQPRAWTHEEETLMRSVAEQTWLIWENALLSRDAETTAERQRHFMRDVFLSVTEGKFHYCETRGDLPPALCDDGVRVSLTPLSGMAELREHIRLVAARKNFSAERTYDLVSAANEAAMNAIVHAGGGRARVCSDPARDTIQVWIEDSGPGISMEHLPRATLELGFTTTGTMGHGFKMMLQTADRAWLLTNPAGTTVVVEQDRVAPEPIWQ